MSGKWAFSIEHRKADGGQVIGGSEAIFETPAEARRASKISVEKLLNSGWMRSNFVVKITKESEA